MFVLTETNSIALQYITELRDVHIQKDRLRFRHNIRRIGEILAYEISKQLVYEKRQVQTPLAHTNGHRLAYNPVLMTILRAGLPFYEGFSHIFDAADSAFIGAYRGKPDTDLKFDIEMQYVASPSLEGRILIIADPMLATGKSLLKSYFALAKQHGTPSEIHIASVIAAQAGVDFICKEIPNAKLWIGTLDPDLDAHSYIVPGLGDAGDLAFGGKI
ncbi:MAG: uracil phosphoribosyltransferase [Bernardetiaceae bacterium]|nr:uracil phosphoribosyltransferase [Bernardetiaceae bacterium]